MKTRRFAGCTAIGCLSLAAAAVHAQPSNDECSNAITVANHSSTTFDLTGATRSAETVSCNTSGTRTDIWFKYIAAGAEQITVSNCGSATGTRRILTAYSGTCGGTEVACSENSNCGTQQPLIVFETPGAGTYLICVNIRGTPGPLTGTLHVDAVPAIPVGSDACSGAMSVFDGDNNVRNTGATRDATIECAVGGSMNSGADVWYTYTAPVAGVRNFEITSFGVIGGAPRNSTLAIFDACGGSALACDDNSGTGGDDPKIYHFPVTAGTVYKVRVSGWGNPGDQGVGVLNISAPRTPVTLDDCELALPVLGQITVPFTTTGMTNSDRQRWDCKPLRKDGWFAWTPSVSGVGVVDGCGLTGASSNLGMYDACGAVPRICAAVSISTFLDPPNAFCQPKICFDVVAGDTYIVRAGVLFETDNVSGDIVFSVRPATTGIVIPAGAISEPGNCGDAPADDVNGGCSVTPNAFTPLDLCTTRTGTASSRLSPLVHIQNTGYPDVLTVDRDWYEFTITTDQMITIVGESEFPPRAGIYFGCPETDIATSQYWTPSCTGLYSLNMQTTVLVPGTYSYRISPQSDNFSFHNGVFDSDCTHGGRYWFTITGSEPCPPSNVNCCRGTTCLSVGAGACTGSVAGSAATVVGSCGNGGSIASCCFADFNHDGSPSIDDLFLYLNAYFTGSPWANVGGDGVEAPTIDDLFLYINAYFTGCA